MNKYYIRCSLKNVGPTVFSDLTLEEAQKKQEQLRRKGSECRIFKYK